MSIFEEYGALNLTILCSLAVLEWELKGGKGLLVPFCWKKNRFRREIRKGSYDYIAQANRDIQTNVVFFLLLFFFFFFFFFFFLLIS